MKKIQFIFLFILFFLSFKSIIFAAKELEIDITRDNIEKIKITCQECHGAMK